MPMRFDIKLIPTKERKVASYNVTVYRSEHAGIVQYKGIVRIVREKHLVYVRQHYPEIGGKQLESFAFTEMLEKMVIREHERRENEKESR